MDLEFKASQFTWCNKRGETPIRERLDRGLGNVEFRIAFDHAIVFHVDPIGSYHHALIVDCCYSTVKAPKSFKFEASWTQHDGYLHIVEVGWNDVVGAVNDRILDLIRRLDACRRKLVVWSRREFPNFRRVIDQLRRDLSSCYDGPLTDEKLLEAETLVRQIEDAWDKEESYWWQRLRIAWLGCGDRNTKFFHNSVVQ